MKNIYIKGLNKIKSLSDGYIKVLEKYIHECHIVQNENQNTLRI